MPAPGWAGVMMLAPAILPWMEAMALADGVGRASALRRPTVKATRRAEVGSTIPVTTSSSMARALTLRAKSIISMPSSRTRTFSRNASA